MVARQWERVDWNTRSSGTEGQGQPAPPMDHAARGDRRRQHPRPTLSRRHSAGGVAGISVQLLPGGLPHALPARAGRGIMERGQRAWAEPADPTAGGGEYHVGTERRAA
jgi:hypothetical protein